MHHALIMVHGPGEADIVIELAWLTVVRDRLRVTREDDSES